MRLDCTFWIRLKKSSSGSGAGGKEHLWSLILEDWRGREVRKFTTCKQRTSEERKCKSHLYISHLISNFNCYCVTWYFMSMLKNSSLGSGGLHASHKCPTLFCAILMPKRSPILALWSSSLRLWELAIRSKNSSVWVREMREEAPDSKGDWGMEDWGPDEASWAWALGCWGCWQRRFSMPLLLGSLSTVKGQTSLEVTGTYP